MFNSIGTHSLGARVSPPLLSSKRTGVSLSRALMEVFFQLPDPPPMLIPLAWQFKTKKKNLGCGGWQVFKWHVSCQSPAWIIASKAAD